MPLARRELCRILGLGTVLGVGAGGSVSARAQAPPLEIVAAELPDTIRPENAFDVAVTVENTEERTVDVTPTYAFDGRLVLSGAPPDKSTIPAGERETFTFGGITLEMIDQSTAGPVEPGTYTHSIGLEDGPRRSSEVTVSATSGTPATTGTEAGADTGGGPSEPRERGFFSNDGDDPEFLSNVFNLTVIGFLLSVAGIVHQLIGGR